MSVERQEIKELSELAAHSSLPVLKAVALYVHTYGQMVSDQLISELFLWYSSCVDYWSDVPDVFLLLVEKYCSVWEQEWRAHHHGKE